MGKMIFNSRRVGFYDNIHTKQRRATSEKQPEIKEMSTLNV